MIKILIMTNVLFWFLFALSGEVVALVVGILNFLGIVAVALINYAQNRNITKQNQSISELSKNVDGKMDKLLEANKRADVAEGKDAGRIQAKNEQAADAKNEKLSEAATEDKPTPVIVVQPAEVIVIPKPDETKDK